MPYDFVDGDADTSDENSHGTFVASIVVDCTKEAPIKVLPVRVLDESGTGYSSVVATGIKYAADHGADIINLSLGGAHNDAKERAVQYAVEKGAAVVIAAGNDGDNTSHTCPAHMTDPGVLVVSSGNSNHEKAKSSNYGASVDLMAPGVLIKGAVPGGKCSTASGTSAAAPHVAAAAALLDLAWGKVLSPASLEQKVCTATSSGKRINDSYGYGFLDMSKASIPQTPKNPSEPEPEPGKSVAVEPGVYHIEAYCGKVVEVADSKTSDRANVQLWGLSARNLSCQRFTITEIGNGYTISAVHSGKKLDVADGADRSGVNVWQWHANGTPAQTWSFEDAGDGYVYIKSGLGTYLDVYNNGTANGTNVWAYRFTGTNAQKFKLLPVKSKESPTQPSPTGTIDVTPGVYHIEAYCGKVVEVEDSRKSDQANVQIWNLSSRNLDCQKFRIERTDGGYTISAVHSGKMLDVADGSAKSGANVWQWHNNSTKAQTWSFEDAGGGYVYIKSALGTYLDVYDNGSANGTNVWAYKFNGTSAQRFLLRSVES